MFESKSIGVTLQVFFVRMLSLPEILFCYDTFYLFKFKEEFLPKFCLMSVPIEGFGFI